MYQSGAEALTPRAPVGAGLEPLGPGASASRAAVGVAWNVFDVVAAIGLLVFTLPLMGFVALLIKLSDWGPVFYSHERIGYGGRSFRCWKFRSMVQGADVRLATLLAHDSVARAEWDETQKLQIDPRITVIGRLIRKTSIDELPQLFNVVMGDMSLVGPRPIVASEIPRYGRAIRHYVSVRPGITGLWQISGRNNTTYRRRVALDVLYARRRSLSTNFHILWCTPMAVLNRVGSY